MNQIALRLHEMGLQLEGRGMQEIVAALDIAEREIERLQQELLTALQQRNDEVRLRQAAEKRATPEPPAVPVAWRFVDDETGVHLWSGSQPPPHNRDLDWEPLYEAPASTQPPRADERNGPEPVIPEVEEAWGMVFDACQQAWPDRKPLVYSQSPTELIIEIINERDEAMEDLKAIRASQSPPPYQALFQAAVQSLAEISVALVIPDDVASTASGNVEILEAIAELKRASQPPSAAPAPEALDFAAAMAHRACLSTEHDPENGKCHGLCLVCGIPWPCETAKYFLKATATKAVGHE